MIVHSTKSLGSPPIPDHNDLNGLQGGIPTEYYHLSNAQTTNLHSHTNKTILDGISSLGSGQIITAAERSAITNNKSWYRVTTSAQFEAAIVALGNAGGGFIKIDNDINVALSSNYNINNIHIIGGTTGVAMPKLSFTNTNYLQGLYYSVETLGIDPNAGGAPFRVQAGMNAFLRFKAIQLRGIPSDNILDCTASGLVYIWAEEVVSMPISNSANVTIYCYNSGITLRSGGTTYQDSCSAISGATTTNLIDLNNQVKNNSSVPGSTTKDALDYLTLYAKPTAGAPAELFFDESASDIGGYHQLLTSPSALSEVIDSTVVNNNTVLIDSYSSEINGFGITSIPGGTWTFGVFCKVSAADGISELIFDVFHRDILGVEWGCFSCTTGDLNNLDYELKTINSVQPSHTFSCLGRLVINVYAKTTHTSDITVSFIHNGNSRYSFVRMPVDIIFDDRIRINNADPTAPVGNDLWYNSTDKYLRLKEPGGGIYQVLMALKP